eukprot:TRINITY_DN70_c0_g2_i2.p1 TRINITY_DN70_c0_g2~~TRINITY_DN70_c0_g2_i2.p1  ORF type:complete len:490 (-),score=74.39 TRINITY_DN70_c0_g2_i2:97-1566(-)
MEDEVRKKLTFHDVQDDSASESCSRSLVSITVSTDSANERLESSELSSEEVRILQADEDDTSADLTSDFDNENDAARFGPCSPAIAEPVCESDEGKKKIIKSIIHQITTQKKPIYRCQLPIFIMEPRSLLEKLTDFFAYSPVLLPIGTLESPKLRFLEVLRFYLSAWHLQIPKGVKNPFNPVLGEVFRCSYGQRDDAMEVIVEQITHHPPSSAFAAWNVKHRVAMEAYVRPHIRLAGNNVETVLHGNLVGHLFEHDEMYVCTYPKYIVKGILFGTLQMELGGKTSISCESTGYHAEIEFKSSNQLSNSISTVVVAKVKHASEKKTTLYALRGNWDSQIWITDSTSKQESLFIDVTAVPAVERTLPPEEQQEPHESRKVWGRVMHEIICNDEESALRHKTEIEEVQRHAQAERKKQNAKWIPRHFVLVGDTYKHPGLREKFGLPPEAVHVAASSSRGDTPSSSANSTPEKKPTDASTPSPLAWFKNKLKK